jgi:hypothetical protein
MCNKNIMVIVETKQCAINVTLRRVRVTTVAVENARHVTYSECASVVLVIQHKKHMSLLLYCRLWLVRLYSTLSHK